MLRDIRSVYFLLVASGVACATGREYNSGQTGGAAGMEAGSGGSRAGSGGASSGSGGTSKGGAGRAGSSGSGGATGGGSGQASGAGGSSGRTSGPAGEGGEDTNGGSNASGDGGSMSEAGSGGSGATGATGAVGGNSGSAGGGNGGNDAGSGSGGAGSGNAGSSGSAGSGGAEVIGGCDNQLLRNANFDAGPTPIWREESDINGLEIIVRSDDAKLVAEGATPHSGNYLAWLGGIEDNEWDRADVILRQDVTIPAEASALTLTGQYWVKTADSQTDPYDVSYMEFEDDSGVIWQAQHLDNTDYSSGWVAFESTTSDMVGLAGQTVTFVAYSRTDLEGKTSFFLDSLRLQAECGR